MVPSNLAPDIGLELPIPQQDPDLIVVPHDDPQQEVGAGVAEIAHIREENPEPLQLRLEAS